MIEFWVPGRPQAQGSKVKGRWGNLRETNSEVGPWRERVALAALDAVKAADLNGLIQGPVVVGLEFVLYRPASLSQKKVTPPGTKKPDIDKLERSINDALTGVVWHDDSQVVTVFKHKRVAEWGEGPGVHVCILEASDTPSDPPPCYRGAQESTPVLTVGEDKVD